MADSDKRRSVGRPHSAPEGGTGLREVIIASCFKALAMYGPLKFSLKDVANLAGVSPASIYYYFGDKETLHRETIAFYYLPLMKRATEIILGVDNPMELLVLLYLSIQEATDADPNLLKMHVNETYQQGEVPYRSLYERYPLPSVETFLAKLKKGQEDGVLRPEIMSELMYLTLLGGALFGHGRVRQTEFVTRNKIDRKKARDHFLYLFCLSVEGPKCDYDWRSIHFPNGMPGQR
ncbi:MAG: TetR/AcrR family transcriptional regulator [Deltaproteobacteria bacterium]|jgi:AcrR family transcriptional regulator|nr:TetR/AcrR family transcriptional regulator [Deltaproteobacteria bacterium]